MKLPSRNRSILLIPLVCAILSSSCISSTAAKWHFRVPYQNTNRKGTGMTTGYAYLWLPSKSEAIRGLLVPGDLTEGSCETTLVNSKKVREACARKDIGIVFFTPHFSALFPYWKEGNKDADCFLKALKDLAEVSGRREVARVPWITAGHSTAGIYCRNIAYWRPERTAGVIHIKSGNFHMPDHIPPEASLAGIPLVAINGQFETFGPVGGLREEYGRETQWIMVREDIWKFREMNKDHLMSLLVHPGADHFNFSPELCDYSALYIEALADTRLPETLPPGNEPVKCKTVKLEDGWLSDPNLYSPEHDPAPYAEYKGDKSKAMWHPNRAVAEATASFHRNLGNHQALKKPELGWINEGDGWTFKAVCPGFEETMPEEYGAKIGGMKVGHSDKPFVLRPKIGDPIEEVGPGTFRVLEVRRKKGVHVNAYHPGDERYRSTIRWGKIQTEPVKNGQPNSITFPEIADIKATSGPVDLKAVSSSGLPVHYKVDYGLVEIKAGKLVVSDIPPGISMPAECSVTAFQLGRRTGDKINTAEPVSRVFRITD